MQINIWPTTNRKEYTRACDCKRRLQQTLPICRSWPNRNQSYDHKIVRSGVTGALHIPPIVASDCKWRSWEASPIGRATSWSSLWLVELLIVRLIDTQSRTTGGATTHEWWCDHTRLVARPCKTWSQTYRRQFWTWPSTLLRLILLVRSPTTTTISGTFSLRFDSDSYTFRS